MNIIYHKLKNISKELFNSSFISKPISHWSNNFRGILNNEKTI